MPHKRTFQKRESGYALVIVLLVITVFSILGLGLISGSFTHSTQFNKEILKTKATNVAEMGLKEYNQSLKKTINQLNDNPVATFSEFQSKFNDTSFEKQLTAIRDKSDPNFLITTNKQVLDDNRLKLTINSVGSVNGAERTIKQEKVIKYWGATNNSGGVCTSERYLGLQYPCLNDAIIHGEKKEPSIEGNVQLNGNMSNQIDGFNLSDIQEDFKSLSNATHSSDHSLNDDIDGNLIIDKESNISGNLTIRGNVYATKRLTITGNVVIEGYVFFAKNTDVTASGNGSIIIKKTAFFDKQMRISAINGGFIEFGGGIVTDHPSNNYISAQDESKITINAQSYDPDWKSVTIPKNHTNYQ